MVQSSAYTIQRCSVFGAGRSPPKYKPFCGASVSPPGTTDVMNTRSPQTIGDDQPWPGIAVFHRTFFVVLQVSGSCGESDTPERSRSAELRPFVR